MKNAELALLPINQPDQYEQLEQRNKELLQQWINERVKPYLIQSYNPSLTSYGLKHYFEREIGVYITNGAFKGGMLAAGILPQSHEALNWVFKVGKRFYK